MDNFLPGVPGTTQGKIMKIRREAMREVVAGVL